MTTHLASIRTAASLEERLGETGHYRTRRPVPAAATQQELTAYHGTSLRTLKRWPRAGCVRDSG